MGADHASSHGLAAAVRGLDDGLYEFRRKLRKNGRIQPDLDDIGSIIDEFIDLFARQ